MTAACGSKVVALKRLAIGSLKLDPSLESGACRELTPAELELIFTDGE